MQKIALRKAERGQLLTLRGADIAGHPLPRLVELTTSPLRVKLGLSLNVRERRHKAWRPVRNLLVPEEMEAGLVPEELAERVLQKQAVDLFWQGNGECVYVTANLGCDPEVFVRHGDGRLLPAWEFLPGKKEDPATFWDGFQAEFTTEPQGCLAWAMDQVQLGLCRVLAAARRKDTTARLTLESVVEVPEDLLRTATDEHVTLGCAPSKNVYGPQPMPSVHPRELGMRFAGGHKHFGGYFLVPIPAVVRVLDAIWGVASVSLFEGMESPARRTWYGRAGEYRVPAPGRLEYRTPSNAWLCHPAIAHLSWVLARQAIGLVEARAAGAWELDQAEAQRIINELDVRAARTALEKNARALKALLWGYFRTNHGRTEDYNKYKEPAVEMGVRTLIQGAGEVLNSPTDLEKNWRLGGERVTDRWLVGPKHESYKTAWINHSEGEGHQWHRAAYAIKSGLRI